MLRGLYIAGIGMRAQMDRMDVLSNNLANVDTTAFKRDLTVSRSFTDEMNRRIHGENPCPFTGWVRHGRNIGPFTSGLFVDEVFTDFSQGRLTNVSDPYSLAIVGSGFFAVSVGLPTGEVVTRYTRDGSFTISSQGMLLTKDGGTVLDVDDMPIYIPVGATDVTIDRTGRIVVSQEIIATLQIVDFEDLTTLRKVGNNFFATTPETVPIPFEGEIMQGYLEGSNANAVREMIELINISRIYEANSRFVQAMDQTLQRSVNEVGRK